jgi:hypothetical protein
MPATRLSARVMARLVQAEACELDPHYRDDLRIARLIVRYAETGEAVLCSPHELASYMVLGLHPEKVWPAIQARRNALGPMDVWAAPPVPKKPAQAVRLWTENTNARRAVGSSGAQQRFSANHSRAMSTVASTYRKPSRSTSGNSLESPHELVPLAEGCDLHLRDRSVLVAMLESNAFALMGSRNFLFPSTQTVAVILGLPYITVRRAINRLEAKGVLVLVHGSNWIEPETGKLCRPCTYQVNPEKLQPRMTLAEHRRCRFGRRKAKPIPITQPPKDAAPANPQPERQVEQYKEAPPQTELTERQRSRLRRRTQAIIREWKRGAEARVGGSDGDLLFIDVVRRACDDEFIDFELAWPWLRKLWWRNEHGWRKAVNREGTEDGA